VSAFGFARSNHRATPPLVLKYRADIRTLVVMASFFALITAAWQLPAGWMQAVATVVIAQISFVCAVITHNTIHCPMFKSRWLNKLTQVVLTLTYGHPVSSFVPGHNLAHHHAPQSARDVMRTTKLRFRWNLLNQLFHPLVVSGAIMKGEWEYCSRMRTERPRWFRQLMIETVVLVAFVVTLGVLDFWKLILFVILPYQFAAWGIIGINFFQHDGCDEHHPHNHSRNFTGRFTNWWLFNNGFHAIHHMHPSLHWSLLREAHDREVAPYNHPNLDQASLFGYGLRALVWPGKRLRYDGAPLVLPDPIPDESWVPARGETPATLALGAEEDDPSDPASLNEARA